MLKVKVHLPVTQVSSHTVKTLEAANLVVRLVILNLLQPQPDCCSLAPPSDGTQHKTNKETGSFVFTLY